MINESAPEKRAPEPLDVVQRFVNSADLESGEDELDTPGALVAWMTARDLCDPGCRATAADHQRALKVREGLRAVLDGHNGASVDQDALEALEAAAGHASLRASFTAAQPRLAPVCGGIDAGLATLLGLVTTAAADGSWQRLKACADDGCRWAFYDQSRNRSGRWCSMATCGNQQKARSFRERARTSS